MTLQLDSHEAVHRMIADFDLRPGEIDGFLRDHGADPVGVIHYGVVIARAALDVGDFQNDPAKGLVTLFCAGVALGMHLTDLHTAAEKEKAATPPVPSCDCPPKQAMECRSTYKCKRFNTRLGNAPE